MARSTAETKDKLWTGPFISIVVINLVLFLSFQVLTPTLPVYAQSIGAGDRSIGLLIGLVCISSIITRLLGGMFLDRFGRKLIFLLGLLGMTAFTFGIGFVTTVGLLLLVRTVQGLAWGVASTASSTMAADSIARSRLGEGMGYYGLSTSLALAIAPALGLFVLQAYGFHWVTLIGTLLLLVCLVLVALTPEPAYERAAQPEAGAGVLAAMYEKTALLPALMMMALTAVMGANSAFIAVSAYSREVQNIGLYFIVYALAMILSRPLVGKVVDRYGLRVVVFPTLACLGLSLVMTAFAGHIWVYCLAGALFGAGFAAGQTAFQTMAVTLAPRGRIGAANGTFFVGFDGGMAIGSVLAGLAADAWGYAGMYLFLLVFILLAAVLFLTVGEKRLGSR